MSEKPTWTFEAEESSSGTMFSVYDESDRRLTEAFISEKDALLIAAAPAMKAELKAILSWARFEKTMLRPREIESIENILAATEPA